MKKVTVQKKMDELRKLQLCILDIALELKRICDKHNINYFLVAGSLLGAVRHQAFIPWDDDMDIGMLRSDYERFLEIAPQELKQDFFLQTYKTDPSYAMGFAKIRINNTLLLEDVAVSSKQHNGIYLDIFPYDNMSDSRWKQKLRYIQIKCLKWAAYGKTDYKISDKKRRCFAMLSKYILFYLDKEKTVSALEKNCKKFSESNNIINYFGGYQDREYARREIFLQLEELPFEGYMFKAPSNYKELLTKVYGDYMKLPPVEERGRQHNFLKVDIGKYQIKNNASL